MKGNNIMKLFARVNAEVEFTEEEMYLLIDASLGNNVAKAINLLQSRFNGDGYIPGGCIQDCACELNKEKYCNMRGFDDIDF